MKRIIHIAILLICTSASYGQTETATSIVLSTGDCRKVGAYPWFGADTVSFYTLPDNKLVLTVIPRQHKKFPIKIENILVGNYKLAYKNIFHQSVTREIALKEQISNAIIVCPDKLLDYPQNTLSLLKDKDTISIQYRSQGCFNGEVFTLIITKEANIFVARLYNSSTSYVKKSKSVVQYKIGTAIKSVTMTDKNIQDFISFENELNYVTDGGCTTTDWYEISSSYLNTKKTDGSCSWNGFNNLRSSLFGELQ